MGSGKTVASTMIAHKYLSGDSRRRVVISVPQTILGHSFASARQIGDDMKWLVAGCNNLCGNAKVKESTKSKALQEFLLSASPSNWLPSRVMVCTHQTLTRAVKELGDSIDDIQDVLLLVDESHHSMASRAETNRLGSLVRHFLGSDDASRLRLMMITATPFRGDQLDLYPPEHRGKIQTFTYPFDRFFAENNYTKSFRYDFVIHPGDWIIPIKKLFEERVGKTIVFIPPPGPNSNKNDKIRQVRAVAKAIGEIKKVDPSTGTITVNRHGEDIVILDLVDEEMQSAAKAFFRSHRRKIDVIVNIKIFTEGADWPEADREVIIGAKDSLTLMMQMIGRVLRDDRSKANCPVEIFQLIRQNQNDAENMTDDLNECIKAIYASMLLEAVLNPVKLSNGRSSGDIVALLSEMLEERALMRLIHECSNAWSKASIEKDGPLSPSEVVRAIGEVMQANDIDDPGNEIAELIIMLYDQRTKKLKEISETTSSGRASRRNISHGMDISDIDVQLLQKFGGMGWALFYTNALCGVKELRDFRKLLFRDSFEANRSGWERFVIQMNFGKTKIFMPSQTSADENERRLASWAYQMITSRNNGDLSSDRERILNNTELWSWSSEDIAWHENRACVEKFYGQHGRRPRLFNTGERNLAVWCKQQLQARSNGTLKESWVRRLSGIHLWTWKSDDIEFEEFCEQYETYRSDQYAWSSRFHIDEVENAFKNMNQWIDEQRRRKASGEISVYEASLLNRLSYWRWDANPLRQIAWCHSCMNWVSKHGRPPSLSGKTFHERCFAKWLSDAIKQLQDESLPSDLNLMVRSMIWTEAAA